MSVVILPYRGEFGQMIMTYVRWVHGIQAAHKTVCCRRGDEALFPSADEYFYDWEMPPDVQRNTKFLMGPENREYLARLGERFYEARPGVELRYPLDGMKPQRFPWCPEHNFIPKPRCPKPCIKPEILVAPRFRRHGEHRNYRHWHEVIDGLEQAGYSVGLLGVPETSIDRPGLPKGYRAWDHEDNLGVTLHWMSTCRRVLCTDSGIAHLAVLAGSPLQVIYGKEGVEAGKESWRWTFDHMKGHSVAKCEAILGGWDHPVHVVMAVLASAGIPCRSGCSRPSSRYAAARGNSATSN